MSAYGGYQKTSYGDNDGGGGGFMGGSTQQGSQSGGGSKFADDTLRPVTIHQLITAEEPYPGSGLQLDGSTVTQVTLIGQVRAVKPQATNITYTLDDGTGVIDVKKWIDLESSETAASHTFDPDTYVRVFGRLTSFNGKKNVGAHHIRPVENFNEVNYHLLEATYVHLYLTKGASGTKGGAGDGNTTGGDGMFVDGGNTGVAAQGQVAQKLQQISLNARKMYHHLQEAAATSDEGTDVHAVCQAMGWPAGQVHKAADELLNVGMIYTTLNEETWAVLDY